MTALLAALILSLAAAAAAGEPADLRFERANALYRSGDFGAAAAEYESLAAEGFSSPSLHLNLGNARWRLGRRGPAVASWERALRLDPSDADARENLRTARRDDPDRALVGEPTLAARIVGRTGDGLAAACFLLPWSILWGALALRSHRVGRARRALGLLALIASLGVLAGGSLLAGRAQERRFPLAVVTSPTAQVRAGPGTALKTAFELHEGTRLRVRELSGDFALVRLEGGLEGWVTRSAIEPL